MRATVNPKDRSWISYFSLALRIFIKCLPCDNLCSVFFCICKLHVFTLALITIITLFAEEIMKGNATSYRCNYVIFTRVIRLAPANPPNRRKYIASNIICDAKISYRNATVSLRFELLAISQRSDYSAVEFDIDEKGKGR